MLKIGDYESFSKVATPFYYYDIDLFQNTADKQPHQDKDHDADEDVERPARLHQFVDIVQHQSDQENIDDVFDPKFKWHGYYLIILLFLQQKSCVQSFKRRPAEVHNETTS